MTRQTFIRPRGQSLAIVIFTCSGLGYLKGLRSGYRHCMIAMQDGGEWLLLDPLSNGLQITRLGEALPYEIIDTFRDNGLDAIATQRRAPLRRELPWAPFTCVEAVKRALGLSARWVVTPWQLRRTLSRRGVAGRGDGLRRKAGYR